MSIANQGWVRLWHVLVCDWQPVTVRSLLFFERSFKTLVDLRQRKRADGRSADSAPECTMRQMMIASEQIYDDDEDDDENDEATRKEEILCACNAA